VRRLVTEPPTASLRSKRESSLEEAETPVREHVVNVTIGRIEVRALPSPPVPARRRSERPKPLGLDDYLKQRGAGR